MKVSELQPDDVVWIYNSKGNYYVETTFVQHNDDGTTRFHFTGVDSFEEPDHGFLLGSVEIREKIDDEGNLCRYVVTPTKLAKQLRKVKHFFKTLFAADFGG